MRLKIPLRESRSHAHFTANVGCPSQMSLSDEAEEVLCNLGMLLNSDDYVPEEVAQRLIGNSAYWYGHHSGPVPAPNHANRVTAGDHGWEIEFGANTFLVELAIRRCVEQIEKVTTCAAETGVPADEALLRRRLALAVRGSVANYNGHKYSDYYDASDGFMHFGTQAIHVASFVSGICEIAEIYRVAARGGHDRPGT